MRKIKYIFSPFLLIHIICFLLSDQKEKIQIDAKKYIQVYGFNEFIDSRFILSLITLLLNCPEFRNVFYVRVFEVSHKIHFSAILEIILPPYKFLSIATSSKCIGSGFYIEHGNSTIVRAKNIGENCQINQNVTLGGNGRGIPTIGNNVRIGTGAVVLGPIFIGNNVIIGANSTIVKNVPDNCTVVPSPSYIIKINDKKVYQKL